MERIALIGPESTGKTTLSQVLAEHFHYAWTPEYAREYIKQLHRPYTYDDIEQIARHQQLQFRQCATDTIFDTDLIITKVWFDVVYGRHPLWLDNAIKEEGITLYLLCQPDIPWQPDPTRENGHCREQLYQRYKQEVIATGIPYAEIQGILDTRQKNAVEAIMKHLK